MEKVKFCDNPKCRHNINIGVKYLKHGIQRRGYGSLDTKVIHSQEVGSQKDDGNFARLCDVCRAGYEVVMGVNDGLFKGVG